MVKIRIVAAGKDKDKWITDGCEHFIKLLSRFARIELKIIASRKPVSSLTPAEIRRKEAQSLAREFSKGAHIALADTGRRMDSRGFARMIEKLLATSGGVMTFIVGGPYGLDDEILRKADHVVSLSPLTFSHQIVRLVLLEQLYRAFAIIHGTDYHK